MNPADAVLWGWIGIAIIGILVTNWALLDGYTDRRVQRRAGLNSDAPVIVRGNLRTAQAGVVLHVFFLLLGLGGLASARPEFNAQFVIYASGYYLVALFNIRAVLINQLERVRMRREYAQRRSKP